MMRALLIGAAVALGVVVLVVGLMVTGVVDLPNVGEVPDRLLVIATAPDEDGAEVAALAFVLERDTRSALVLDTMQSATIPNTSAGSAREAYPFVGGKGLAKVLAAQTAGEELPWVILPAETWGAVVDEAGGIEVDIPTGMSVYREGSLVVLDSGASRLSGRETAALLGALGYIEQPAMRTAIAKQVAAEVSTQVALSRGLLGSLVEERKAESSVDEEALSAFSGAP